MTTKFKVTEILQGHIGKLNGITGDDLSIACGIVNSRTLRSLIDELIEDGMAVCSHPARGYYMAANAEELEHTCQFHRGRAMHELHKESRLRKIPLPDLLGQLHLKT